MLEAFVHGMDGYAGFLVRDPYRGRPFVYILSAWSRGPHRLDLHAVGR